MRPRGDGGEGPGARSEATPPARRWRVWREDDHGRRFEVSRGHTEEEARLLVAEYERRGHRQSYGAEPER